MRCPLPTLLTIIITLATPLAGRQPPAHLLGRFYQALPGKAAAYNKALSDIADPILDELVRRKQMCPTCSSRSNTGAGENTNLVILEFPNWGRSTHTRRSSTKPPGPCSTSPGARRSPGSPSCDALVRIEIYTRS